LTWTYSIFNNITKLLLKKSKNKKSIEDKFSIKNLKNMIENEELDQWVSEFYPTVETDVLEVLRARVQYAILDQLNYMISGQTGSIEEIKKIVLEEITEITNESIEVDTD
jgi:hypothetical protein|tara:strand:- start:307 stop:636 length:330 start_codon:yes stop_codon:yes gene_type:complete